MIPCSSCGCHVLREEQTCPHCSASLVSRSSSVAMVLLGLSLAGACSGSSNVDYGASPTEDPFMDTDADADSDTDTDTDTDTDSDADTDTGSDTGAG